MRSNKRRRILAIDPGTRNIGVAVIEGNRLLHYGVKTIPRSASASKTLRSGRAIVRDLIADFMPTILAVEQTYFPHDRNGTTLNRFASEVTRIGRRERLAVVCLAANTVRKMICGFGTAGKRDVATALSSRFPELRPYLTSNRRWKERYYFNLFDATALGLAASAQFQYRRKRS